MILNYGIQKSQRFSGPKLRIVTFTELVHDVVRVPGARQP